MDSRTVSADGASATISAQFGGETADVGTVPVATVELAGESAGTTPLSLTLEGDIFTQGGLSYSDVQITGGQLTVTESIDRPEVIPGRPSQDTDGDGLLDDLNGNDEIDRGDAQALFGNLDEQPVTDNAGLFDYNDNGEVDRGDVQALFQRIQDE